MKEIKTRIDFGYKLSNSEVKLNPPLIWHFYWWDIFGWFSYLDYAWDK